MEANILNSALTHATVQPVWAPCVARVGIRVTHTGARTGCTSAHAGARTGCTGCMGVCVCVCVCVCVFSYNLLCLEPSSSIAKTYDG